MGKFVTIDFHGDQLVGFEDSDGAFVALKPMVENIGLAWHGQYERMKRDSILSEGIRVIRIPFVRGGEQEAVCLPVDLVPGFLFRIDVSRIKKPDIRAKMLDYQRDCYRVLSEAFGRPARDRAPRREPEPSDKLGWNDARKMVTEIRAGRTG